MVIFVQSADAREHHHGHRHHHSLFVLRPRTFLSSTTVYIGGATRRVRLPGVAGRCAISLGADPGPSFNLARNWAHRGRPGSAGIGAVVVWPHHVGKIVGQQNGEWVIESGNDGHAVRVRPRSIAGAIAIRWG
jgi:hypothetical protein